MGEERRVPNVANMRELCSTLDTSVSSRPKRFSILTVDKFKFNFNFKSLLAHLICGFLALSLLPSSLCQHLIVEELWNIRNVGDVLLQNLRKRVHSDQG